MSILSGQYSRKVLVASHVSASVLTALMLGSGFVALFGDRDLIISLAELSVLVILLHSFLIVFLNDLLRPRVPGESSKSFTVSSGAKLALLATITLLIFSVGSGAHAVLLGSSASINAPLSGFVRPFILFLTIVSAAYAVALSLHNLVRSYHEDMATRYDNLLEYARIVKDVNRIGRASVLKDLAGISHSISQKDRFVLTQDIMVRLLSYTSTEYLDGHMVNVQVSSGDKDISRLFRAICDVLMNRGERASYKTVSFVDFWSPLVLDDARAFFGNNQACAARGVSVKRLLVLKDRDFQSPRRDLFKEIVRWHVEQYMVAKKQAAGAIQLSIILERDYFDNPNSKTDLRNYVVCSVRGNRRSDDMSTVVVDMEYVPTGGRKDMPFQPLGAFHFLDDQRCEAFNIDFERLWQVPDSLSLDRILEEVGESGDATQLTDQIYDWLEKLHAGNRGEPAAK